MAQLIPLGPDRCEWRSPVRFNRSELGRLLSLYSRRVAEGEWRDYAIGQQPGRAVFAIFRHSRERPLYLITKHGDGGFEVASGLRRVASAATLEEALAVFDRRLRLVH